MSLSIGIWRVAILISTPSSSQLSTASANSITSRYIRPKPSSGPRAGLRKPQNTSRGKARCSWSISAQACSRAMLNIGASSVGATEPSSGTTSENSDMNMQQKNSAISAPGCLRNSCKACLTQCQPVRAGSLLIRAAPAPAWRCVRAGCARSGRGRAASASPPRAAGGSRTGATARSAAPPRAASAATRSVRRR
ncbi:hypothetical protein DUGA2_05560 [Duganella sp. HH101]|nr:hypothetical protein DUGA2_05560 [Duganella sp. HH101]